MKLHLPLAIYSALCLSSLSHANSAEVVEKYNCENVGLRENITSVENDAAVSVPVRGGAIHSTSAYTLSNNETVSFDGYSISESWVVDADRDGIWCDDEGCVYKYYYVNGVEGGAIYNESNFTINESGVVSFNGNSASFFINIPYTEEFLYDSIIDGKLANGGAIYNAGTFLLCNNEKINFKNNSVKTTQTSNELYYFPPLPRIGGGAIHNSGIFTLCGSKDIAFSGNSADNFNSDGVGGAIYNNGTFEVNDNEKVTFSENYSVLAGGDIYNEKGTFTIRGNKNVNFNGHCSDFVSEGGAVYNEGTLAINSNEDVVFSNYCGNSVLCNGGSFFINSNSNVTFRENSGCVISNGGGIFTLNANTNVSFVENDSDIFVGSSCTMSDNENISFTKNTNYGGLFTLTNHCGGKLSCNGNVVFSENSSTIGGAVIDNVGGNFMINNNNCVSFKENTSGLSYADYRCSGAIANTGGQQSVFTLSDNGVVSFVNNMAGSSVWHPSKWNYQCSGAIYNSESFSMNGNEKVIFVGNTAEYAYSGTWYDNLCGGGAIANFGPLNSARYRQASFTMSGNSDIAFSGNKACNGAGGAIANAGVFSLCYNGNIVFSNNSAVNGGAIYNANTFIISQNGDVVFSGNYENEGDSERFRLECRSGAILNDWSGTFTLSSNGNILFEKNLARTDSETYQLRSICSYGILNLSASEGKNIIFKDSIYVNDTVNFLVGLPIIQSNTLNLNQDGSGNIIFNGASVEADLREMKGGIDGTTEEILNSRTSDILTNTKLYGGRLIVEEGAILKGQGITVMENANAVIRLNNGEIDESGYEIAVSSGSGLEFEGVNTLTASAIRMEDGTTLSFVLGDSMEPLVNLNATLLTGSLSITLSGNMAGTHQLITLQSASQYDVSCWTQDKITVSGASFYDLVWDSGVLTYNPHDKFEININSDTIIADDSETSDQLASGETVKINGNGHSLTVKNEVQLVQMALKNGTVKLEGENNNVVSVTLTEDGTLVLTAGAGLKTGDIISMVASGKGELVISGDITLDEHGMKGKAGSMASVSNMSATTTGDAVFENVAFTDSLLDIGEGTTATFRNAVLGAGTRVTDAPATAKFENTLALLDSTNTEVVTESTTAEALQLYRSGDTANAVTLDAGAALVDLTCTVFDTITLSGSDLYLDLTALAVTLGDADAFSLTFTNGTLAAIDTDSLRIYATLDGEHYLVGYTTQQSGMAEKVYFTTSASVPEPATATLSLLALAALAARRRRK